MPLGTIATRGLLNLCASARLAAAVGAWLRATL